MVKLSLKKSSKPKSFFKKEAAKKEAVNLTANNPVTPEEAEKPEVKTRGLDFIIISSLFFIFLICPLFFTGLVAQGMGFEKMILFYFLVLIGTVAWVTKAIIRGELKLKRTPLDIPIIALLVISIISTIMSVNQQTSLIGSYGNPAKGLIAFIIFILFYYLLINNIDVKRIKLLFWTLVSSLSLIITFTLLQLLSVFLLPVDFTQNINFNPIGSLSSVTMFIVIILPILVLAVSQIKEISPKLKNTSAVFLKGLFGIITLVGFVILVFLNGITFWLAAIAGMIVVLLFFISKTVRITNNNLIIPITAFFLLIIFLVLGNFNIIELNVPVEVSLSRSASWDIAKQSLKENPVLGSGPSTFYYSFSKFKSLDINNSQFWNTRFSNSSGFIFEHLANIGILGALAVISILIVSLLVLFKAIIRTKLNDIQSILLALFSSLIIILIVSSFFAINNSLILISVIIFCLTIGAYVVAGGTKLKEINLSFHISAKSNLALALIFLAVSAGVIAMFTMGVKTYMGDYYARKSLVQDSVDGSINMLQKAIQLAPYHDIYYINLANNYIGLANEEAGGAGDQNIILTNLNQAIKHARTAIEIAPEKAANNEFLALIYENASLYTQGGITVWAKSLEESYNKVIELEPNNPIAYYRIALIKVAMANVATEQEEKIKLFNEAIENYAKAIAKKSDLGAAYYGKGIAYERLNNIDAAIEDLRSAVESSGGNIDYGFELGRLYFNRGIAGATMAEEEVIADVSSGSDDEEGDSGELSIEAIKKTVTKINRNEDIDIANQIFLNIIQVERSHANALYSLGLLYQAVGEEDNAKIVIDQLLLLIEDGEQKNRVEEQFKDIL